MIMMASEALNTGSKVNEGFKGQAAGPRKWLGYGYNRLRVSQVAQQYRIYLPMQEMKVQSMDWEDPLEEEMATHSSILAWRIPWTEESSRLQSMGSQKVRHNWARIGSSVIVQRSGYNIPL